MTAMVNNIYCPVPWNEVHINADGTYHTCGAQPNRVSGTPFGDDHCVQKMTVKQWMASVYQAQQRSDKLLGVASKLCEICYHEEHIGSSSKRIRELKKYNNKFVFTDSDAVPAPSSYHISIGNECNLACKMCGPAYSSKIASNQKKIGLYNGPVRLNWTDDEWAWSHVVESMCNNNSLEAVHVIGGEPLLNPKFESLVDALLAANKTDIYLGFTTNGTVFNQDLLEKLNNFRHVDIGVSIECMGSLNDYVRAGSDYNQVLENIDQYLKHRVEGKVYITLRAVPSALSVHTLDELFHWCIDRRLDVMTNILVSPEYLQIKNLPQDIKNRLLIQYQHWVFDEPAPADSNHRDPNYFKQHIDNEVKAIIKALEQPGNQHKTKELYEKLALWHWLDHDDIAKYFETIEYV